MSPFSRVLGYCRRWRVDVRTECPPDCSANNSRGNFTILRGAIFHDAKPQYASYDDPLDLLHELSHVLNGCSPNRADELGGPMLALDYYGTRFLRLAGRRRWMADFGLDDHDRRDWGEIGAAAKHAYLQRSLRKAVQRGLLTREGKPTFRRKVKP
jgi:hypothetical protein